MGSMMKFMKLWKKVNADGDESIEGRLGDLRLVVLENRHKRTPDEHTHVAYLRTRNVDEPSED